MRWLSAKGFKPVLPPKRTRVAGHISSHRVRFYNMELTPASTYEARQTTLEFLRRAIRHIEEFDAARSGASSEEHPPIAG